MSMPVDLRHVSFEGVGAPARGPRRLATAGGRAAIDPAPARSRHGGAAPVADEAAVEFGRWVLARASLDASAYRAEAIARRVPACLRALRAQSPAQARERLVQRPALLETALSSLLLGVTEFFRDPHVFDDLRSVVVPALAERRRLRVWSAGCASGAELYSFAILLAEAGILDRAYLLGSDCRAEAIAHARHATWRTEEARGIGASLFSTYFTAAPFGGWQPVDRLRHRVHWKVGDVMQMTGHGPWDVVFWRNMAIYLEQATAALIFDRLSADLAPSGFLVAGKAERPPDVARLRAVGRCIYRRDEVAA